MTQVCDGEIVPEPPIAGSRGAHQSPGRALRCESLMETGPTFDRHQEAPRARQSRIRC